MIVARVSCDAVLLAVLTASGLGFGGTGIAAGAEAAPMETTLPIIELRQYTLHPGTLDVLVDLFEREFIESQEAVGMKILGQFRDVDRPDRFVWIRAFKDMPARAEGLNAFYNGPVWHAHRDVANSTMVDSDNVLLLHVARPGSGFIADDRPRPPKGAREVPHGLFVVNIYHFDAPVEPAFVRFFEKAVRPLLDTAGIPILASFVSETGPNNFPRLPVREGEHVFVWFSRFADRTDYDRRLGTLVAAPAWKGVAETLHRKLKALPEAVRLQPTPRSQLRD
jgi:NIPSNAP